MKLETLLQRLYHPDLKEIDLSLRRMHHALQAAGSPHLNLPPVIHFAGTNGKGSTLAMFRAVYEAAGYKVHAYTSPHLVHVRERFYVAGNYLDDDALISRIEALLEFIEDHPLTFFEAMTMLAFQLFEEIAADVILLETGMGGQFDATNVIPHPALTVISPISMDHQAFLGNTIADIAYEKACIMKTASPCIAAPQLAAAEEVLAAKALELKVPLQFCGKDFTFRASNEQLIVESETYPLPNLPGEHQLVNASVALRGVKALQPHLPVLQEDIAKGLTQICWPARLQCLNQGKYADWARENSVQLWLDGGHNAAAAAEIASWIVSRNRPFHLVLAMSQGHDPQEFLAPLANNIESLSIMEIPNEPLSHSASVLHEAAQHMGIEPVQPCVGHGLLGVLEQIKKDGCEESDILLTGSLYFAGKILAEVA